MPITAVIVDDSEADRYIARRHLARHPEFGEVLEACDGVAFLEDLCAHDALAPRSDEPVLILMDVNMPALDGFETLRQYEQDVCDGAIADNVTVVIFTSSEHSDDLQRAAGMEMVKGYLVKPFDEHAIPRILELTTGGRDAPSIAARCTP